MSKNKEIYLVTLNFNASAVINKYEHETSDITKDWLKDIVNEFYKPKVEIGRAHV